MYKIKGCTRTDVYHYHGSFFSYDWSLITDDDKILNKTTITDYSAEDIIGKNIVVRDDLFYVVN